MEGDGMPYICGKSPEKGDRIRHRGGKTGTVTWVQLNYPSMPGHDAIAVKFDDGSAIGIALAADYTLASRSKSEVDKKPTGRSIEDVMKEALRHYEDGLAVVMFDKENKILHGEQNLSGLAKITDVKTLVFNFIREVDKTEFEARRCEEALEQARKNFLKRLAK